ncbi:copper-binding protein [Synechococcus sp. UW140]|uniref:copper-binding protein n=1 Tax=Synechococcus sp. UW140 TaxID=368503 RepID=UPI0025FCD6CF|nr:copper-binding protein [Synechococcus sp. UW140]
MNNPFRVRWLEGWTFQTVLIGGRALIEAYGFGVCLRTDIEAGESPNEAADRLVLVEDRLRRSLRNAWKRGPQHLLQTVIDVESADEVQLQEDLARNAQHLQPAVSPRQEVMQGLRR